MHTATWLITLVAGMSIGASERTDRPNVVIIFADDLGYADLGCFGSPDIATPNLDRMAEEGIRFTNFYVPAAVCSASRAALLTGCYPQRVGILGALGPGAKIGINADERLLPERLKELGYATAIFGKWHLGDRPQFLPTRNGFDTYFGLPYSNDMWPKHPTSKNYPDLPLMENERQLELNPDQTKLTTWYTERAVKFIEENQERPFFLYVPHNMPHVPLFVSDKFAGKSRRGLYGDVVSEIDWSVGQILETLKRLKLDDNTLVIFTSDNGPWLSYGDHGGSAGPLREGKGTTWDGGQRVPMVARWPGKIRGGSRCDELASTIDVLPTVVKIAGGAIEDPKRKLDGRDIGPLLRGEPGAKTPHEYFAFYWDYRLEAIRSGNWKLHFPHAFRSLKGEGGKGGQPGPYVEAKIELALFDLANDIGERHNVAADNPDVVKRLSELAEEVRKELGDTLQNRVGSEVRPAGRVLQTSSN